MIVGCGDLTILLVGLGFHCFLLKCKEKLRHSLGRPSRSDFVQLEVVEVMRMKKDTILILIAVAAILALVLPKPAGMIIPLIILIPVVIYLIVDIIKNGNKEKK